MKRFLCLFFSLLLILPMPGCQTRSAFVNPVIFYYPRKEFTQGQADSVLASLTVEGAGHNSSTENLLNLFLQGPEDESFTNPFPADTRISDLHQQDDILYITLSEAFSSLSGLDLTLACASLTKTAISLTGARQVSISILFNQIDGRDAIVMDESSLLTLDDFIN